MDPKNALACLVWLGAAGVVRGQSGVVGWGSDDFDHHGDFVQIASGGWHTLALGSDGSVAAWGYNGSGQCDVPVLPAGLDYEEVAGGWEHSYARASDGSIVAWGDNLFGQCDVPALPAGITYVELASGAGHGLARASDGSVVAWGHDGYGQCAVPPLPAGLAYVHLAAGDFTSLALRSDGSIVAWGDNASGQCNVPALPSGLVYVEVAGGYDHSLARRSDGSVVAFGGNQHGQCVVPALPAGSSFVAIAAAGDHSLALASDGSVVAWGSNSWGQGDVPVLAPGLACFEIAAGHYYSLARYGPRAVLLCAPGDASVTDCPCANPPAGSRRGCDNSAATGGARIAAAGLASVSADTLAFTASGERPTALSLLLQGSTVDSVGAIHGQGVRCVGGSLEKLFARRASAGVVTLPDSAAGDASITERSAALGVPILPGQSRWYLVSYRDPIVLGGCSPTSTFNTGPTMRADWVP